MCQTLQWKTNRTGLSYGQMIRIIVITIIRIIGLRQKMRKITHIWFKYIKHFTKDVSFNNRRCLFTLIFLQSCSFFKMFASLFCLLSIISGIFLQILHVFFKSSILQKCNHPACKCRCFCVCFGTCDCAITRLFSIGRSHLKKW